MSSAICPWLTFLISWHFLTLYDQQLLTILWFPKCMILFPFYILLNAQPLLYRLTFMWAHFPRLLQMSTSLWWISWNSQTKLGSPLIPKLLMIHFGWLKNTLSTSSICIIWEKKIMLFFTFRSLKYGQEHSKHKYILRKKEIGEEGVIQERKGGNSLWVLQIHLN